MGYKCREVMCNKCKHIFMWMTQEKEMLYIYQLKDNDEILDLATCPRCGLSMLLLPYTLEGISEDSENVIKSVIRGL